MRSSSPASAGWCRSGWCSSVARRLRNTRAKPKSNRRGGLFVGVSPPPSRHWIGGLARRRSRREWSRPPEAGPDRPGPGRIAGAARPARMTSMARAAGASRIRKYQERCCSPTSFQKKPVKERGGQQGGAKVEHPPGPRANRENEGCPDGQQSQPRPKPDQPGAGGVQGLNQRAADFSRDEPDARQSPANPGP